jgi:hypothetical protein
MNTHTLVAHLSIAANRRPDWTATRGALVGIDDEELEDLAVDLRAIDAPASASAVRAALAAVIDRVEAAIREDSPELWTIHVPGWVIYATAGAPRGKARGGLFDDFCDLQETGLSYAAGFTRDVGAAADENADEPADREARSADENVDRDARFARLQQLLEPRLVFGPDFTPETRYVFLCDEEAIDGCYRTLEEAQSGFGNRGSEFNPNPPPPLVVDLDDVEFYVCPVSYHRVHGMEIEEAATLLLDDFDGGGLSGTLEERREGVRQWLEEVEQWLGECA